MEIIKLSDWQFIKGISDVLKLIIPFENSKYFQI